MQRRKDSPNPDKTALPASGHLDAIIGSSPAIRRAIAAAVRIAVSDCAVLIHGPTGAGKELFAQTIHAQSGRPGPLISLNCATLRGELLEAELFGFVKGAFTGAARDRAGLFQKAHGGTLFLDELGELSLAAQASLLRVLQEKCVRPVGSAVDIPINVRIIAATHRDLAHRVQQGQFREDLYYRLVEGVVEVPSLQDRKTDIPAIARHLLATDPAFRGKRRVLSHEAARALVAYSWPGNVRELKLVLKELVRETRGRHIRAYLVLRLLTARTGVLETTPVLDGSSILHVVKESGEVTAAELGEKLHLPRTSVLKLLKPLIVAGQLEPPGRGWQARYRVGDDGGTQAVSVSTAITVPPASDSSRALLVQRIEASQGEGCTLEELLAILPDHSRNEVKVLLRALKASGQIHSRGRTRGARWFEGVGPGVGADVNTP